MPLKFFLILILLLISYNSFSINGCRLNSAGTYPAYHRVYYIARNPNPTQVLSGTTYEVWLSTSNYAIFPTPPSDCGRPGQGASQYLLSTANRTANCVVYDTATGNYVVGMPVTFNTPLQCPIDEYIPVVIFIFAGIGVIFIRRFKISFTPLAT